MTGIKPIITPELSLEDRGMILVALTDLRSHYLNTARECEASGHPDRAPGWVRMAAEVKALQSRLIVEGTA